MSEQQKPATKAEVQTTKLNKLPVPGASDTEFSAEEAAEVFKQQSASEESSKKVQ